MIKKKKKALLGIVSCIGNQKYVIWPPLAEKREGKSKHSLGYIFTPNPKSSVSKEKMENDQFKGICLSQGFQSPLRDSELCDAKLG